MASSISLSSSQGESPASRSSINNATVSDNSPAVGENGEEVPQEDTPRCLCEIEYDSCSGAKRCLYAMCLGLGAAVVSDGEAARQIGDFGVEPFSKSRNKKFFKPSKNDLIREINRRFIALPIPPANQFKPQSKRLATDLEEWLKEHPITNETDVAFLKAEEHKFFLSLKNAAAEKSVLLNDNAAHSSGILFNDVANMRLIHCLAEDKCRDLFIVRNKPWDRQELDARNSPLRPKHWSQVVADTFNDASFKPVSNVWPELHR